MERVIGTMLTKKKTYNNNNIRDTIKTFNNGVCDVYVAEERTIGQHKGKFNYAYESVGINQYYQAYNNNIGVDMAISVPQNDITIDTQDIVKINDDWYKIVRIQYHDNKRPFYWTLSLQKSQFSYVEVVSDDND